MSNENILLTLHDGLSKETAQKIYPADLAHLLGYGATQIKEYVRTLKAGRTPKPNARLERAAHFAVRLGELEGFSSLFPLIPKLSGNLDNEEWMNRTGMRIGKMINAHESSEVQLDLIDGKETETDHQIKKFFGFASPLSLDMIEQDTKSGHIPVPYDVVIEQLIKMFGKLGHYEFAKVKAALVALECPEMVVESDDSQLLKDVKDFCKYWLSELLPQDMHHKFAEKVVLVCEEMKILDSTGLESALQVFFHSVSTSEKGLAPNIRLIRQAMSNNESIQALCNKSESAHQMSDIIWPEFVDERTQKWLKDYDKEKLSEALSYGGELVVMRVLAGYVKEVQEQKLEQEMQNMKADDSKDGQAI
ncbi:hypothetical protein L1D52_24190 [Vibrio brasiliensis]|uniref:hypothetical protein n=1 Tax=Vibrio brasiliensis TaxID=170652 RepID=UPI001EFEA0CE|nr:hypothetical protein [Vibrio brasiliensis]MCG9785413.1 hypothetical protein [Vibrio brasiliensis]